jgi:hypothetical protein
MGVEITTLVVTQPGLRWAGSPGRGAGQPGSTSAWLRLAFAELTFEVIDLVSDGHGTDITHTEEKPPTMIASGLDLGRGDRI